VFQFSREKEKGTKMMLEVSVFAMSMCFASLGSYALCYQDFGGVTDVPA